ncbi:MAG: hypothetical protein U9R26_03085 [Campylobacterota bacterium]|nr:hypothetical protein [Campylobacterota bacterium]
MEFDENIKEIIKSVFNLHLSVDGGWGYSEELATHLKKSEMPTLQLEHTIASMRAHLEMSITRKKEERYGGINLNEIDREEYRSNSQLYHKVTYAVTAIKEIEYNAFIEEYKENYGKKDFDMSEYFERRREATLGKSEIYWFRIDSE